MRGGKKPSSETRRLGELGDHDMKEEVEARKEEEKGKHIRGGADVEVGIREHA